MRVLRAIVRPKPLLVTAGQAQTAERRGVGAQLVAWARATLVQPEAGVVKPVSLSDH